MSDIDELIFKWQKCTRHRDRFPLDADTVLDAGDLLHDEVIDLRRQLEAERAYHLAWREKHDELLEALKEVRKLLEPYAVQNFDAMHSVYADWWEKIGILLDAAEGERKRPAKGGVSPTTAGVGRGRR